MSIRTIIICGAFALPLFGVGGTLAGDLTAGQGEGTETGIQDPVDYVRKNNGKFSGIIFGDFYSIPQHHDPAVKGREGTWVRRLNLTFDNKWSENVTSRIRVEAKDNGGFSGGHDMVPFFKDAWLQYNAGGHKFTFGLIPTPTWEPAESALGYRPVEKTALDLFRMGSSRDKGLSVAGPLTSDGKANYTVMIGDGSGTKSMTEGTHTIYARVGYQLTPEISLDLYGDWWQKRAGVDWTTVKGEVFFVNDDIKAGLAYAHQLREMPGMSDLELDVLSFYGEYEASDMVSPFIRVDILDDLLPDANKIEYYRMSPNGKPTLVAVGVRIKVTDSFEITPSWTNVSYRGVGGAPAPGSDSIFRLTFIAKF